MVVGTTANPRYSNCWHFKGVAVVGTSRPTLLLSSTTGQPKSLTLNAFVINGNRILNDIIYSQISFNSVLQPSMAAFFRL